MNYAGTEANAQTTVWLICLNARQPTIFPYLHSNSGATS
jgi:hypothetical protein